MRSEIAELPKATTAILYAVTPETISQRKAELLALRINGVNDETGLAHVKAALRDVVKWRTSVEKTRKEAKDEYLKAGQKIDAEAKQLQALIEPIESHLASEKKKVEDEIARLEMEAQNRLWASRQKRLIDAGDNVHNWTRERILDLSEAAFDVAVSNAVEATRIRKEAEEKAAAEEAERKRLASIERENQRAEAERLKAERAEFERAKEEQAKESRRIQAEFDKQQFELKAERERLAWEDRNRQEIKAREEQQKQQAMLAEQEKADKIERDRLAAEQARIREQEEAVERVAAEARAELLKPIKLRIREFAVRVQLLVPPDIRDDDTTDRINAELLECSSRIIAIGEGLK